MEQSERSKIRPFDKKGIPAMVRKTLEQSSVYQKQQSEEARKALENVGLRVGVWIMQYFPEKRIKNVTYQWALTLFKTLPMGEKREEDEEILTAQDYFVGELSKLPFGISNPRKFLNGLFRGIYFQLGGKEHR